jgi:branched-chain amino acid aminotransferase
MQTMADRDGVIWFDGEMVEWREAKVHVLTHTLHYGMGVFEGVRAYKAEQGTAIFRLQAHTNRLFDSAHIMQMKIPFDKDTINEAQRAAVSENNLESAYIRPMCFYGSEGMGIRADNLRVHWVRKHWTMAFVLKPRLIHVIMSISACVKPKPMAITSIPCWHYTKQSLTVMTKPCC